MKVERLKKKLYLFSISLLTLFMLIIVFYTLSNFDYADYLSTFMNRFSIPVYLLTGSIFIFAFVHVVSLLIKKCNQKQMRIAAMMIGLFIIAIQILVIYFIRSPLRSDPGMVFDQALDMFTSGSVSPTAIENYFAIYPNNIPLCILEHLVLKLGSFMGLKYEYFLFYLDLMNVMCIDLGMYFAYQIIKMLHSRNMAVTFMVLCAINPLLYAYTILVYTSTLSMPFIMGTIYFFLRASREQKAVKKVVNSIAAVFLLYFGYRLRATVVITLLAILIYLMLQTSKKFTKEAMIKKSRLFLFLIITLVLSNSIYHAVESKYVKFDYSQTGFPITHWLMMGAQGSGGFNEEDFNDTLNIPTKEERVRENLSEYKKRIYNLGVTGTVHLVLNKLRVTWSDGLDATIDSMGDNKTYYAINDYLTGSKKDLYVSYCHMYNLMLMILVLVSVCQGFKRKRNNPILIIYLNLLGGILFHLLWEAGAAYNICFTFLTLLLANDGREIMSDYGCSLKLRKVSIGVCSIGILSTLAFVTAGYDNLVETPFKQYPIAANQDFHENECPQFLEGDELIQTFVTSRPFNRIGIKVRNFSGDANESLYTVQLLDEKDKVIVSNEVVGSLAFDTDYYRIPLDLIVPEKATTYKLKITTQKADKDNNIVFMMYNTGNWNVYEDGNLFLNGEETRGSLTFQIYESVEASFLSRKKYLVLAGMLLLMEIVLTVWITVRKCKKEVDYSLE